MILIRFTSHPSAPYRSTSLTHPPNLKSVILNTTNPNRPAYVLWRRAVCWSMWTCQGPPPHRKPIPFSSRYRLPAAPWLGVLADLHLPSPLGDCVCLDVHRSCACCHRFYEVPCAAARLCLGSTVLRHRLWFFPSFLPSFMMTPKLWEYRGST